MPTQGYKTYLKKNRMPLYQLMQHAYSLTQAETHLEGQAQLNALGYQKGGKAEYQAQKYARFQFVLPPLPHWQEASESLKGLFEHVFADDAQNRYQSLREEHPDGVDCWINPVNASQSPVLENQAQSSLDSIDIAAHQLISEINSFRKELNNFLLAKSEENQRLTRQESQLKDNLAQAKKRAEAALTQLPNSLCSTQWRAYQDRGWPGRLFKTAPKHPFDEQFKQAHLILQDYHRYAIAQLALFEQAHPHSKPHKKEYKKMYQRLAKAEQSMKTNPALTPLARQFNQDIFVIHFEPNGEHRIQYHDRHYAFTERQANAHNLSPEARYATATAHSPEYLLSNFARYEEASIKNGELNLHFTGMRNGSHSPSELHKGTYRKGDKHETSYLAFSNMEQALLAARTQTILDLVQDIAIEQFSTSRQHAAQKIAYHIDKTLHQKHLAQTSQPLNVETVITTALQAAEAPDEIKARLLAPENAPHILNPTLFHTHLITAPGLGGVSEQQRYQFYSARYAQYATQNSCGGMHYFSFGVNAMRWDTFSFDARNHKVKRNNCVAMIELALFLDKQTGNIPNPIMPEKELSFYQQSLQSVRKLAKEYYRYVESEYLIKKNDLIKAQNEHAHTLKLKQALSKSNPNLKKNSNTPLIKHILRASFKKINHSKKALNRVKIIANGKRRMLRQAEEQLHHIAKLLNQKIYQSICRQSGLKGHWAVYRLIQELFTSSNFAGIDRWKLTENNGVLQSLLQWITDETPAFAGSGCKSANDREYFVAMLVSEMVKTHKISEFEIHQDQTAIQAFYEQFAHFKQKALQKLGTHISNHQTQKDRSNLPKTDDSILVTAEQTLRQKGSSLKHRLNIARWAAHKRQKDFDKVTLQTLHDYACQNYDSVEALLKKHWFNLEPSQIQQNLSEYIRFTFNRNNGETIDKKINKYKNLSKYIPASKFPLIANWISLHRCYLTQKKNDTLNDFQNKLFHYLNPLKAAIPEGEGYGKGCIELQHILSNLSEETSTLDLIDKYMACQRVASTRIKDWTAWKDKHFSFFNQKRPASLIAIYESLSQPHELKPFAEPQQPVLMNQSNTRNNSLL